MENNSSMFHVNTVVKFEKLVKEYMFDTRFTFQEMIYELASCAFEGIQDKYLYTLSEQTSKSGRYAEVWFCQDKLGFWGLKTKSKSLKDEDLGFLLGVLAKEAKNRNLIVEDEPRVTDLFYEFEFTLRGLAKRYGVDIKISHQDIFLGYVRKVAKYKPPIEHYIMEFCRHALKKTDNLRWYSASDIACRDKSYHVKLNIVTSNGSFEFLGIDDFKDTLTTILGLHAMSVTKQSDTNIGLYLQSYFLNMCKKLKVRKYLVSVEFDVIRCQYPYYDITIRG